MVRLGAKVDARRGNETTPIMVHAEGGSLDLVQELLHHNANIDLQDEVCTFMYLCIRFCILFRTVLIVVFVSGYL